MASATKTTGVLEIAYEIEGPVDGPTVFLIHGWPDDPRTWRGVAPALQAAGYRTVVPYLRGFGPTRFLEDTTPRDGTAVAHVQDVIDLADAIGVERFSVVGHDWGARIAYYIAALFPDRIERIVAMSVPWQARGVVEMPPYDQARAFWYQWFMSLDLGAAQVRATPIEFARSQWETWSPAGWFSEGEFRATARSWENPDWASVTLTAYRSRYRPDEPLDPRYDALRERLRGIATVGRPTLMIQGGDDRCVLPETTFGFDDAFTAGYEHLVLDGVGHFPSREAPDRVTEAVLRHLGPS